MTEQLAQRVETEIIIEPKIEPKEEGGKDTSFTPEVTEIPSIKSLWQMGEASEHFEMPTLIKEIDDFVLGEMGESRDKTKYEQIIQRYLNKLKLPEDVDLYTKTEKVAELMRIDKKLLDASEEREKLLNSDPTKMTSKQLRRYIESTSN